MATVNNVFSPNVPKGGGNDAMWPHLYALTRCMKKAGWKVLASSDGTSKVVSDDPELDELGAGVTTGVSGTTGSIAAAVNGRAIITGLTSIVDADKGRFLEFTNGSTAANNHYHQIEEVLSGSSVAIDARRAAFTPVADATNGSLDWEIFEPRGDVGPTSGQIAWILLSGPSMIKVPMTIAPSPGATFNFIRGENVVQAVTGAEGEIRGFVFDDGAGYLVVAPRKRGSGADPYGWATGNLVTGDTSGASVSQDGTATAWTQQVVFRKANDQDHGQLYIQCVDKVNEGASDFETLASAAGCTATVQPGGGGTGNGFPTVGTFTVAGNGGSTAELNWNGSNSAQTLGTGQVIAVDAIEEEGYSPSGSWASFAAGLSSGQGMTGYFLCIADDGEPGDLSPYVGFCAGSQSIWSQSSVNSTRTACAQISSGGVDTGDRFSSEELDITMGTSQSPLRGFTRSDAFDNFHVFEQAALFALQVNAPMLETNAGEAMRLLTDPATNRAKLREPVRICCTITGRKTLKGTLRHFSMVQGGQRLDTYDLGKHMQLSNTNASWVWTPWDEATVPLSS